MRQIRPAAGLARQRGVALLMILLIAAFAVLATLGPRLAEFATGRLAVQAAALPDAKRAVLGYVRANGGPDYWGLMPLPDMGKRDSLPPLHIEGEAPANFGANPGRNLLANGSDALLIGRLPFKTLGLPALRDPSGACLWYAVSAAFKFSNVTFGYVPTFNWDSLGDFETNSSANPHQSRALALLLAPGAPTAGQDRQKNGYDTVDECRGNYMVGDYLEGLTPAVPTTDANGAVYVLPAAVPSATPPPAAAMTLAATPTGQVGADQRLTITTDEVFDQIVGSGALQSGIDNLLTSIETCLENTNLPTVGLSLLDSGGARRRVGKLAANGTGTGEIDCTASIAGAAAKEYARWRDNLWLLVCDTPASGCITLDNAANPGSPQTCDGLLVFAGRRTANQRRSNTTEKADLAQYLESTAAVFQSAAQNATVARLNLPTDPLALSADVARCLVRPGDPGKVELDNFQDVTPDVGGRTLVQRDTASDILTLGNPGLPAGSVPGSAAGCSFSGDSQAFADGARFYFRFQILRRGDGFTFALLDADRNGAAQVCGGAGSAGQYLGYASRFVDAGGNPLVPPLEWPKIGLEFDTARNSGGATNVGDTTNAHLALVYWGRSHDWPNPQPASPYEDDNTHGQPTQPQAGYGDPFADSAFGYPALRSTVTADRDFHVRFDVVRTRDGGGGRTTYVSRVWIRRWDQMIAGMDNVAQDFTSLTGVSPDHADTIDIVDPPPGGEVFRNFRFGWSNAQSTRTQQIVVRDARMQRR